MNIIKYYITLALAGLALVSESQFLEDHSIIHGYNGSVIVGKVLNEDAQQMRITAFNDTLIIPKRSIDYRYRASDIGVLKNGKFHVTNGYNIKANIGANMASPGARVAFGINKIMNAKTSLGFSFITQGQDIELAFFDGAQRQFIFLNHGSFSFAVGGKHYLSDYFIAPDVARMYGHFDVGYALSDSGGFNDGDRTNTGVLLNYGLGIQWANRKNRKCFLELSQSHQKVIGNVTAFSTSGEWIPISYDLWLNNVTLTFGWEFNLQLKSR